jgi:hypothetical protein
MLSAIVVTVVVVAALGYAQSSGQLISRRPYNNRYSDASAAREDHLG